jgi:O-antigen ligase
MFAWVFSFDFKTKWRHFKQNRTLLIILLLFAISLLGMTYTSNSSEGWRDVEVKLSLFLIPIAIGACKPLKQDQINTIVKAFAYTVALAVAVLIVIASVRFSRDGNTMHFFYGNFASFKRIPTHYFALYVNFSLFIMARQLIDRIRKNKKSLTIVFHAILLLVLIASLYLCSVRIQFIAFVIGSALFMFWHFGKKLKAYQLMLYLFGGLLLISSIAWVIPESRRRITETLDEYSAYRGREEQKQMNHRVFLWKYGWEVVKENFWIGTGTGSANDELYEYLKHEEAKFWDGKGTYTLAKKKYNLHNEFLQHFATYGIVGLAILMLVFILALNALPNKLEFVGAVFLLLTFISFNTESMLERQAGNLFFAFFYAILFINKGASTSS